jgi:glycosidase
VNGKQIDSNSHKSIEQSLKEINWPSLTEGRKYFPSPSAWEDQVLYFLLVDRFSNGNEYGGFCDLDGKPIEGPTDKRKTPLFDINKDAYKANRETWFNAGKTWCGGTIAGLKDKIGYLQRLGVTAIWISPIFKQVADSDSYHGYGIQNFLDVEPNFGSREELRDLVEVAHSKGTYVVLDIILNHAGDIFAYKGDGPHKYSQGNTFQVQGFHKKCGDAGSISFGSKQIDLNKYPDAWPNGAVWPNEFQEDKTWTRQGEINDPLGWNNFPEYLDADFFSLKDINHGIAPKDLSLAISTEENLEMRIHKFSPLPALVHLSEVYKFWIAYADIDGFRIDTVKHMEPGAVRFFANVIHEFAQSLGKENFYLIGEVAGGRDHAVHILNTTGIDATLGIDDIPDKLEYLAKGKRSPGNPDSTDQEGYFDLFRNSLLDDKSTHQWYGKHIVVLFDDHDQVGVKHKYRFCADNSKFLRIALALNLTTMGIPCIYYGTEQAFNGADCRKEDDTYSDVFLRECMFGGSFGSFQSTGRHFFDETNEFYQLISNTCSLRLKHIALRRGRQYLRKISHMEDPNDSDFYYPQPIGDELRWVVAWSRIFADQEYLCAINTDAHNAKTVWANVDYDLNPPSNSDKINQMTCILSTDHNHENKTSTIYAKNGSAIQITVPPAGFIVYANHKGIWWSQNFWSCMRIKEIV